MAPNQQPSTAFTLNRESVEAEPEREVEQTTAEKVIANESSYLQNISMPQ